MRLALPCALVTAVSLLLVLAASLIARGEASHEPITAAGKVFEPRELAAARWACQQAGPPAAHEPFATPGTRVTAEPEAAVRTPYSPGPQYAPASPPMDAESPVPSPSPAPPPASLARDQMVVFYGTPLAPGLGILGRFEPGDAARRVRDQAGIFDAKNGDRGAVGALDLIYSIVQREPTRNGLYLSYLPEHHVHRYLDAARAHGVSLILDLQIGRGNIPEEVRKIERYLLEPDVHVAVDPEYAVGPHGVPIATPGRVTAGEINDVQRYLAKLAADHNLPPKILFLHQYIDGTVVDGERVDQVDGVDLVLNMDAFGEISAKQRKYAHFAAKPHARKDGFNVFLEHDERVLTEDEILDLQPLPDVIFYQ
jgi:hypothetical protein